jgi:phosphatidylserine decarboxylase
MRGPVLRSFARHYGIDVAEAEKPLEAYSGVGDFFIRRLRPGARPVDGTPGVAVWPSDGKVVDLGTVHKGKILSAKGSDFSVEELVADREVGGRFEGGCYAVIYLAPHNYHRVHTPVAGRIVAWHYVPGVLLPVNDRSVAREPRLFAKNERFVTVLDSEAGLCAVVMVAAVGVGHVTASYDPEVATHAPPFPAAVLRKKQFSNPPAVKRGEEIGIFNMGSTAIVLFEPGRVKLNDHLVGTSCQIGRAMGSL